MAAGYAVQLIFKSPSLFLQLLDYSGPVCHFGLPADDSRDKDRGIATALYDRHERATDRLLAHR